MIQNIHSYTQTHAAFCPQTGDVQVTGIYVQINMAKRTDLNSGIISNTWNELMDNFFSGSQAFPDFTY